MSGKRCWRRSRSLPQPAAREDLAGRLASDRDGTGLRQGRRGFDARTTDTFVFVQGRVICRDACARELEFAQGRVKYCDKLLAGDSARLNLI